ncbi:MAG: SIS domain-containing protein [Ardenticatenaceae bacterium]|nr:SIS domain-containing protein [Ardenticatenaceae bacterium]
MNGQHTYQEITTQPTAWEDALTAFAGIAPTLKASWQALDANQVLFIGCGSTHYLSLAAAALFQQTTGVAARAVPSSELLLFDKTVVADPARTLLVAISRSGTTTETITAVSKFQQQGGAAVWTITCYPESPLAQLSNIVLPTVAAQEQSVAQTRSFASMMIMAQALAAHLGGQDWTVLHELPEYGRTLIDQTNDTVQALAQRTDLARFTFLGSGPQYGIASEAMLKMTEMSLTVAYAFHFMEYRHGPMSMANSEAAIIGLLSPTATTHEKQVLDEMAANGAVTLAISPAGSGISLPDNLPVWAYPVLYLPPLQLLAYHRSIAKGLDPDNPRNLTAVVYLDTAAF